MVAAMTGTAIITGWKRTALAVAIAYALVLQGLLLALGGAMHVRAAELPGTVLCLPSGDDGGFPHLPGEADHGLCCIPAGTSFAPAGPGPASIQVRHSVALDLCPVVERRHPRIATNVLPVGSRAPPRAG